MRDLHAIARTGCRARTAAETPRSATLRRNAHAELHSDYSTQSREGILRQRAAASPHAEASIDARKGTQSRHVERRGRSAVRRERRIVEWHGTDGQRHETHRTAHSLRPYGPRTHPEGSRTKARGSFRELCRNAGIGALQGDRNFAPRRNRGIPAREWD